MRSPFKFLDYFEKKDHASFFGREAEKERLYKLVSHHRLSLIYGPSGTGKTSLIRCGLANRIQFTAWLPIFVKRQQNINDSLVHILKGLLEDTKHPLAGSSNPVELLEAVNIEYLRPPYLIFDQLEELYIDGSPEERAEFAELIKTIIDAGLSCRLIFVLREEYLGRLYEFEQVVPIYYEQRLRVEPLTAPVVKEEVIQKSFALFNMSLSEPELADRMLENLSGLKQVIPLPYLQVYLDRLWNAAYRKQIPYNEQVAWEQVEPPINEWPKLKITPAIVDQLGTLEDVFADYLRDQQLAIQQALVTDTSLPACPENFVRSLLDGLVTPEGTKRSVGIERKNTAFEVLEPVPTGWGEIDSLLLNGGLQALAAARLLRVEEESIELAHDSLAAVIDGQRSAEERQLNLYRQQIRASFEMFPETGDYLSKNKVPLYEENLTELGLPTGQRRYLLESKTYWEKEEASELERERLVAEEKLAVEREKRRRSRLFSLASGVFTVIAAVLLLLFQQQRDIAVSQADELRGALHIAEVRKLAAEKSDSISVVERLKAVTLARRDSISRVQAEIARDDFEREARKGKLLGKTLGGSYDELIRQGEEEFREWHLQNALTYWSNARFLKPSEKEAQELVDLVEKCIEAVRLVNDGYWDESEKMFLKIYQSDIGVESSIATEYMDAISTSRINWPAMVKTLNLEAIDTLVLDGNLISIPIDAPINHNLRALEITENGLISRTNSINRFAALTTLELNRNLVLTDIKPLEKLTALTTLELSGNHRLVDLKPLKKLTALTTLELNGNRNLTDLKPLEKLTALTTLELNGNRRLVDLKPLEKLTALTTLGLSGNQSLTDLKPLEKLTALTTLELSGNQSLTDLKPLEKLTALTTLELSGNQSLTDLKPLEKLTALTTLELSGNQSLTDLKPLEKLTALTTLKLFNNRNLVDIKPLKKLTALTTLELSLNENLANIKPLEKLTALTTLKLFNIENLVKQLKALTTLELNGNRRLLDIKPLEKLTALTTLELSENNLADIKPLEKLTALTTLELSGNNLADIKPLEKLTALTTLELSGNNLADIKPLEKLTALTTLELSWNNLADIKPLEKLTALTTLELSGNNLADIKPLEQLTALTTLELSENNLADIKPLEKLTALTTLELSWNNLADIKPLEKLTTLTTLKLSGNNLADIKPLEKLTALTTLELSGNNLAGIKPLEKMKSLIYLDIRHNQLTNQQIEDLKQSLPSLDINR